MSESESRYSQQSEEFDFEGGDTVLVRIRRDGGTSGPLRAKFFADVVGFDGPDGPHAFGSERVVLCPVWADGAMTSIRFKPYEAEFEVVEDEDEVRF